MFRPVSSQVPNVPVATFSFTLSSVRPRKASSQSWIVPAPLVARCVIEPRSSNAFTIRCAPFLIRCAPYINTTAASRRRAAEIVFAQSWIALEISGGHGGGDWAGSTRIFSIALRLRRSASGRTLTRFKSSGARKELMPAKFYREEASGARGRCRGNIQRPTPKARCHALQCWRLNVECFRFEKSLRLARLRQTIGDEIPVHHVPPRRDVIRALVLILQVIRVLPHIDPEQRLTAERQRGVLIGRGFDFQTARHRRGAVIHEPGPAAAELDRKDV